MARLDAVDISNHQGVSLDRAGHSLDSIIDWCMDELDLRFVACKISEGSRSGDGYGDGKRYVQAWRSRMQDKGIECQGVYHWLSNDVNIEAQRDNAAKRIGRLLPNECIQLDMEEAGLDFDELQHAINVWEETWPGRVFYYLGRYFAGSAIDRLDLPAQSWWWPAYSGLADYPTMKARHRAPFDPGVWQWGGGGEGIYCPLTSSRIDSNLVLDWSVLRAKCGYQAIQAILPDTGPPFVVPAPTPTPAPNLPISGDDPMLVILAPEGRNARFFAILGKTAWGQWAAYDAEWIEDGNEMAPFAQLGTEVRTVPVSAFRNIHVNKVPANDGWSEADFRRVG
jgi:hypothetical protein